MKPISVSWIEIISAGDELVSLNRAFLFQSPTVISTLWTVDDTATSLLMERFYKYLLEGRSKADTLRLAQLDVREEYPNPYFWAGFVLSGDWGIIDPLFLLEGNHGDVENEILTESDASQSLPIVTPSIQHVPKGVSLPALWIIPFTGLALVSGVIIIHKWRTRAVDKN